MKESKIIFVKYKSAKLRYLEETAVCNELNKKGYVVKAFISGELISPKNNDDGFCIVLKDRIPSSFKFDTQYEWHYVEILNISGDIN